MGMEPGLSMTEDFWDAWGLPLLEAGLSHLGGNPQGLRKSEAGQSKGREEGLGATRVVSGVDCGVSSPLLVGGLAWEREVLI